MNCKQCSGTGYALHRATQQTGMKIFTNCHCEIGTNSPQLGPKITSQTALPFPTNFFVPTKENPNPMEAWKAAKELSKSYFDSLNKPVQDSFDSLFD